MATLCSRATHGSHSVSLKPTSPQCPRLPPGVVGPTLSTAPAHHLLPHIAHHSLGTLHPASFPSPEHSGHLPNLGISHWLFPLPGPLFPQMDTCPPSRLCSNPTFPVRPTLRYCCNCHHKPTPRTRRPGPASPFPPQLASSNRRDKWLIC